MTHASHVAPEGLCFGEALGVKRMEALREGDRVTIGIWFQADRAGLVGSRLRVSSHENTEGSDEGEERAQVLGRSLSGAGGGERGSRGRRRKGARCLGRGRPVSGRWCLGAAV